ncbi:MAG: hypothetical protein ACQKBT_02720, partial [Puniceicoccales bacterium]
MAVLGGDAVYELGDGFVWLPVLMNAVVMVLVGVAFNYWFRWRRHPAGLATPPDERHHEVGEPSHEEILCALRRMDLFLDVSEDDLIQLINVIEGNRRPRLSGDTGRHGLSLRERGGGEPGRRHGLRRPRAPLRVQLWQGVGAGHFLILFLRSLCQSRGVSRISRILLLAWILSGSLGVAQEIFLGGDEFVLAGERSSSDRELQVFYPYGENERNWKKRVEIHHYPDLVQPRRVTMVVLDRLRERHSDLVYKILPKPTAERAGISYLVMTEGQTEVRLEFLLYEEHPGVRGLMAYRLTYRSRGPDARYAKSLLRGKWDYY